MNTRTTIGSFCLAMAVLLGACPASHAAAKEESPLTTRGEELLADGAKGGKYGAAMKLYRDIQKASRRASRGVLQRLALATSLEHAVPIKQGRHSMPAGSPTVDPVKPCLQYENAYLAGEVDPAFEDMNTRECRFITNDPCTNEEPVWAKDALVIMEE